MQARVFTMKKKKEGEREKHGGDVATRVHRKAVYGHAVLCVDEGDSSGHIAYRDIPYEGGVTFTLTGEAVGGR